MLTRDHQEVKSTALWWAVTIAIDPGLPALLLVGGETRQLSLYHLRPTLLTCKLKQTTNLQHVCQEVPMWKSAYVLDCYIVGYEGGTKGRNGIVSKNTM